MKNCINEFANYVLANESSFTLGDIFDYRSMFVKVPVQHVILIYRLREFSGDEILVPSIKTKMSLIAIKPEKKEKIYMIDYFGLCCNVTDFPENVSLFSDLVKEINEMLKTTVFDKLYDDLDPLPLDDTSAETCRNIARNKIIKLDYSRYSGNMPHYAIPNFKDDDVLRFLCEMVDLEEKTKENFNSNLEGLMMQKTYANTIQKLLDNPEQLFTKCELDILTVLNSINAKTVIVEFEFNGKNSLIRIEVNRFKLVISNERSFSKYDFITDKAGKDLFDYLGVNEYLSNSKNCLTLEHIMQITYKGKILYKKER